MALFFVVQTVDEPGDYDLFVVARSCDAALAFWRSYYELDPVSLPERVTELPVHLDGQETDGAIPWDIMKHTAW